MAKVCIMRRNQFGRLNKIVKKKPSNFALKQRSNKHFTEYSIGTDSYFVPKRKIRLSFCRK